MKKLFDEQRLKILTAGCSGVVVDSCALCDENPGSDRAWRDMSGHEAAA